MDVKVIVSELAINLSREELGVLVAILKDLIVHPNDATEIKNKIIRFYDCIKQFEDNAKNL